MTFWPDATNCQLFRVVTKASMESCARARDCTARPWAPPSLRLARLGPNSFQAICETQVRPLHSIHRKSKTPRLGRFGFLAEREGFEPSIRLLTRYSLSRGAPSASRASLRILKSFASTVHGACSSRHPCLLLAARTRCPSRHRPSARVSAHRVSSNQIACRSVLSHARWNRRDQRASIAMSGRLVKLNPLRAHRPRRLRAYRARA